MELRQAAADVVEPRSAQWRVAPGLVAVKVAGALILLMVTIGDLVLWHDPPGALLAGVAAAGLTAYALRDLIRPVRLAADHDGVTVVAGYARRVRLPWSAVEAVRVDERSRYGLRSAYLEIDAGESIHLYSVYDLNASLDSVAEVLCALRAAAGGSTASGSNTS